MRLTYLIFLLSVMLVFQNCTPSQFRNVAQAEEAIPVQSATAHEISPALCVAAGQKLFVDRPFIYYRVCDNERADWQVVANRYCCSGEATIVDVENLEDAQCAQGRTAGVAYCE